MLLFCLQFPSNLFPVGCVIIGFGKCSLPYKRKSVTWTTLERCVEGHASPRGLGFVACQTLHIAVYQPQCFQRRGHLKLIIHRSRYNSHMALDRAIPETMTMATSGSFYLVKHASWNYHISKTANS